MRFAVAGIILTLYAVLFFIVKRADDVIKRQELQREKDAETIHYLAHHDPLTDLPNRKLFTDRLSITLARAKRSGRMAALLFVDFDHFKQINDTLGHGVGDEVLKEAAKRLQALLRASDTVARLGGDEFTIIIDDIAGAAHPGTVAEKIRSAFTTPIVSAMGRDLVVTPSIGIALYPLHGDDVDGLLNAADAAMYDAKAAGRNAYRFYRDAPSVETTR
jgi:diguanylate cyclase (GGDEF)-like protein